MMNITKNEDINEDTYIDGNSKKEISMDSEERNNINNDIININNNDKNNNVDLRNDIIKCDNSFKNYYKEVNIPEKNEMIIPVDNVEEPKEFENPIIISSKDEDTNNNNNEEDLIESPLIQNEKLNDPKMEENNIIEEEEKNNSSNIEENNDIREIKQHIINSNSSDGKNSSTKLESNYQSNSTEVNLEANSYNNHDVDEKAQNNEEMKRKLK